MPLNLLFSGRSRFHFCRLNQIVRTNGAWVTTMAKISAGAIKPLRRIRPANPSPDARVAGSVSSPWFTSSLLDGGYRRRHPRARSTAGHERALDTTRGRLEEEVQAARG